MVPSPIFSRTASISVRFIMAASGSTANTKPSSIGPPLTGFKSSSNPKLRAASSNDPRAGALLQGKLFDDKGNRMSPSFSSKNGVRYRFYVSSALLRGRKAAAGSVGRVAAAEIEPVVLAALKTHQHGGSSDGPFAPIGTLQRVVLARDRLLITTVDTANGGGPTETTVGWAIKPKDAATAVEANDRSEATRNDALIQSIARAHAWVHCLREGVYGTIEQLAEANGLHPKVVRQSLRLAFLSPDVTSSILECRQPAGLALAQIRKLLSLRWTDHRPLLG
jgi:site-specific DNA recombinase